MKRLLILLAAFAIHPATSQTVHILPPLPYATDALEPVMSRETVELHHGKHVQTYVDNLNRLIPGTPYAEATLEEITMTADGAVFNNGAQILNHIIFFDGFAPEGSGPDKPTGALGMAIERDFGSFAAFQSKFNEAATAQFGSGWAWLVSDPDGRLVIVTTSNADNPLRDGLTPILGIDVWEHSYYVDYRNRRADYLAAIWRIIDWDTVGHRYEER
ncbi:MAG: superoxide dismutase [Rikenellaceae bacterium]|nr:superoxide dismutase [Rikenellaceae bacterium]